MDEIAQRLVYSLFGKALRIDICGIKGDDGINPLTGLSIS